ncbi:endonuclease-reverse transcriptase [Elysia marginata]|uniref:Endonuclease-reverse transcriptase n=1 Tax=Elysia marginata TaxID=1093978 RepID=A0AAV4HBW0_9GAST|nr:endonuclease-reverse transcriptase [Elysia marginata]
MSAAFDTINRSQILDILKAIIKEDELRIVRFLLSNTEINTKINGSSKAMPFMSNVGTPQGDSRSPVLFTIYLENALREIRTTLPEPNSSYGREIPSEIAYADDIDLIGHDYANIAKIQETLEKYQLKVNTDKTEFTLLSKNEEDWKKVKKVGSLIDDNEDIERRKQLSSTALSRLNNLWLKDNKIKTATKIHLYKSLVKSILLYNCSTWALTHTEEEKLNAFHRKQLKKILNIKFPVKITNKSLYKNCQEKPLSLQILESRWKLFGHILRRHRDIPANKQLVHIFHSMWQKPQGKTKNNTSNSPQQRPRTD